MARQPELANANNGKVNVMKLGVSAKASNDLPTNHCTRPNFEHLKTAGISCSMAYMKRILTSN